MTVVEVGPRDGLQNEETPLSVDDRVAFCERLIAAGLPVVEAGAFVSPKWVPQMAGSDEVLRRLAPRTPGVRLPVLVPNRAGFDRARAAGAREIAVFTAASETFNRRNTNASIDESFARFAEFLPEAKREGLRVRGYVSTCFGCPYEGAGRPARVVDVARRLAEAGCDEVSIGDTIGVAVPTQVSRGLRAAARAVPGVSLAAHFHDTRGTALANVLAALDEGVATIDSSAGGLGGCPYAPGAAGNLATEDLVYMLDGMGIETGVDIAAVAARLARARRAARPALPSRWLQAGPFVPQEARLTEAPATILVVDDLPANRDLLVAPARAVGVPGRLRRQRPGGARRSLRRCEVDLVLLDIMMPGMTGLDVLRSVRIGRSAAALPVDHGHRQDGERGRGRGALARRERLRHEARRLPRGARPHPGAPAHAHGARARRWRRRPSRACPPTPARARRSAAATASRRRSAAAASAPFSARATSSWAATSR